MTLLLRGCTYSAENRCIPHNSALNSSANEPSTKVKWAVVALARKQQVNGADTKKRNRLLSEVLKPYAHKHDITVILFSEQKYLPEMIQRWKDAFAGVATVIYINTASLQYTTTVKVKEVGYKYMCKFYGLDMFDYLVQGGYDYYLRVDTDCFIERLNYDILSWTETNHIEYAFATRKIEAHSITVNTLPPFVEEYSGKCGITPTALMDKPLSSCFNFYNNLHIGKVSFFTRPDVRHFIEAVNASGKILSHRWGDSTIQAYAVRLFMQPAHIRQIPNITYFHGSHVGRISSSNNATDLGGVVFRRERTEMPFWMPVSH